MAPTAGPKEYFTYNAVGHTTALTDAGQNVTQTNVYEAFGDTVIQTGASTNNRLANTKERDASIGLDNHGFRYYDSATGRYIQRDPSGYSDGLNVYLSDHDDPVNKVDPQGLASEQTYGPYPGSMRWNSQDKVAEVRFTKVTGPSWYNYISYSAEYKTEDVWVRLPSVEKRYASPGGFQQLIRNASDTYMSNDAAAPESLEAAVAAMDRQRMVQTGFSEGHNAGSPTMNGILGELAGMGFVSAARITKAVKAAEGDVAPGAGINGEGQDARSATPRAARRQAMRDAGIPTSQQPDAQTSVKTPDGKNAGRQYTYETPKPGGGTQTQSVQHSLTDEDHGAHWEAGPVKQSGQTDSLGRPRLTSDKVKVDE